MYDSIKYILFCYQNRVVFVVSSFFIKLLSLLGGGVLGVYCKTQRMHVVITITPLYISDKIVVCNLFSFVDLVRELLKQILLDLVYLNPSGFSKVKMSR